MLDEKFWTNEDALMWEALLPAFMDTLMDGLLDGAEILPPSLQALMNFDVVNQAALEYARAYRYEWIKGINNTTRKQVQQAVSNWIGSGDPLKNLEKQIAPIFGKVRAEMIASTEVTRVFADANQAAWKSTGFVGGKVWMTSKDDRVCPICSPMQGKEVALNNYFPSDMGGGYKSPPAHVRCRCWLQPVVSVDAVLRQTQSILDE